MHKQRVSYIFRKSRIYLYNELFDYSFDNSIFENRFKSLIFQFKNILETLEELKQKIQEIKYKIDYNHQLIMTILNDKDRHNYYDPIKILITKKIGKILYHKFCLKISTL